MHSSTRLVSAYAENAPTPADLHEALDTFPTLTEVGDLFGVHRTTVRRWMRTPQYLAYLDEVDQAARAALRGRCEKDLFLALRELRSILETGEDRDKLAAIKIILDIHTRPVLPSQKEAGQVDGATALETIRAARAAAQRPLEAPAPVERDV